jgi:hypothetical protein
MAGQVQVEDFEVFRQFRVALLKFAQVADQSLSGAQSEIGSVHSWLENEQTTYWQGQFRKRAEAVTRAREAVRQKKLYKDASGRTPGAVEEEKILAKCMAALEQAQEKIEAVRRALPRLEKEGEMYRGGVARLSGTVSVEIPRAVALLDRLATTLEEYVQIEGPSGSVPEAMGPSTYDEPMSRGGEAAVEPVREADTSEPFKNQPEPASQSETRPPVRKESPHVPDGQ